MRKRSLERSIRNEDLLRLMNLQKSLVYFNTSIRGNEGHDRQIAEYL